MKVILFGATGMVGQGVLRECLQEPRVTGVLAVGRAASGKHDPKLKDLVLPDLFQYQAVASQLKGYDACFFCLGISSAGMSEEDYRHITYDLTLAAADELVKLNPGMTFVYVSGQGTDSSERGKVMWARVKGATENALLALPFKAAYMFRPGIIRPLHGIRSKTALYQTFYTAFKPLLGLLAWLAPDSLTSTEQMGKAMINAAQDGAPQRHLENKDINRL
ncbi:MAG TPA: epimerase [Gammaproteobacteria bacterium]|jgi:uncharacterized protein YbjT (DUF2867 family)|nr:epimerase [Gammaproteobacteria bacterium]